MSDREPELPPCSLLLFTATSAEEQAVLDVACERSIVPQKLKGQGKGCHSLGLIGSETVVLVGPARESGRTVMGSHGHLGTAARALWYREATGAQGIVQIGMAFGIAPRAQRLGDVIVSSHLFPYDSRDVKPRPRWRLARWLFGRTYAADYTATRREPARLALLNLFRREQRSGSRSYGVHVGTVLSGAARIHCAAYRDELVRGVPVGEPVVGGEMEGLGLLAASLSSNDPIWCIVKGISDFADEQRNTVIHEARPIACRNAADFVLSALVNSVQA